MRVFTLSIVSAFGFYVFLADLNDFYKKVQDFFFRSSFFSLVFPAVLLVLGLGYLVIPKLLKLSINKHIFIFAGTFILISHFIFIARQLKGYTVNTFINYLFVFSILGTLNLFLFELYLRIAFKINIAKITLAGIKGGAELVQNLFTLTFR